VSADSLFSLEGKVALVTGGSRGIGRAIALGFADAGADVMVVSRKIEACEDVCEEIERRGRRALAYACHVGHWDELDGLVGAAYEHFGTLDVLVNNAGMSPTFDHLSEVGEKLWDSVFALNAKGPFRLAVLVATRMVRDGGGAIINVSSTGSIRPRAGIAPYAAAKSALNTLTVALADEFGPSVRVNTLMPGPFLTDSMKGWDMEAFRVRADATMAINRAAVPEEAVGAAIFLASGASSFTSGSTIRIDGGMR
jgi:NAD(P)-dependent dehydrogenase (short-subunit alcohol dehydrogenase family)